MIGQAELVAGILRLLDDQKQTSINQRQMNAVIAAANLIVAEFDRPDSGPAQPGIGLRAWLATDDTGLSSKAMVYHLGHLAKVGTCDTEFEYRSYHPLDHADFGRCYRLLRAVPELRLHLGAMANVSPEWAVLVAAWDELERLYEVELPTGRCPKLNARMKEVLKEAK